LTGKFKVLVNIACTGFDTVSVPQEPVFIRTHDDVVLIDLPGKGVLDRQFQAFTDSLWDCGLKFRSDAG
jgi:hypothetical protein